MARVLSHGSFSLDKLQRHPISRETSSLFGCNSQLGNEAPAFVLRYAESFDAMREIVPIARGFVAGTF